MLRATLLGRRRWRICCCCSGVSWRHSWIAVFQFMVGILLIWAHVGKLLGAAGAPVGQPHERFQPGEPERAVLRQQFQAALRPRRPLFPDTDLHQRELQAGLGAALAIEVQGR